MKIIIPKELKPGSTELFDFLIENKEDIIAQKKASIKHADACPFSRTYINAKGEAEKGGILTPNETGILEINPVINTTNWFDSHWDVHLDGIWKENLKRKPKLYLIQEHKSNQFDKLITNDLTPITKKMSWRDLGQNYDGTTEALIFSKCKITPKRNPFMYDQYKEGYVDNHSVGMRYLDLVFGINNPDYKEEYATWNKYKDRVANLEDMEAVGFAWFIKQAICVEGSAVPFGSNPITPTLDESMQLSTKEEGNQKETGESTSLDPQEFNLGEAIKQTKFFN